MWGKGSPGGNAVTLPREATERGLGAGPGVALPGGANLSKSPQPAGAGKRVMSVAQPIAEVVKLQETGRLAAAAEICSQLVAARPGMAAVDVYEDSPWTRLIRC